ncbi:hypothetical protein T11_12576 [Trichinella zimbabwensis]|uniref:CCHC-type domain-containing protein n=1 Tax=Trichinella zimbabwensis TaxID=268475 RepID=A0A0V1HLG8_9BILA|nr:hypothetical protein T11_12576 [Trichinella zimbabwensis]
MSTSGACFCPLLVFRQELDPTEWLEKLEDFFCACGVLKSNYGVVGRYLLSDPVRREQYLVRQARENSFEDLKRRLLNTYGREESSLELIERFHALLQHDNQTIKQYAQDVVEFGHRAGVSERDLVARFTGGVASREVYRAIQLQEPPSLAEARELAENVIKVEEDFQEATTTAHRRYETREGRCDPARGCFGLRDEEPGQASPATGANGPTTIRQGVGCFSCGSLDHYKRDCLQLRA